MDECGLASNRVLVFLTVYGQLPVPADRPLEKWRGGEEICRLER